LLHGEDSEKLSEVDADGIRMELIALAFAGVGVWLVLFVVLDWLF